jgi:K+ transporter
MFLPLWSELRSSSSIPPHEDHLFYRTRDGPFNKASGPVALAGALFAWMTRNTGDVTSYFGLPPNGVVELGARVEV